MSYFPAFKLTKKGEELLNKINGNLNETLVCTRGEVGSGEITGDDEIRFLTALKEKWANAPISDIQTTTVDTGSFTRVELQFFNSGLTKSKNLREIGLYAKGNDGVEVLLCYSNAYENYDPIPVPEDNPQAFIINVTHQISTGTKVTAEIPFSAFVTIYKLENELNKWKSEIITAISGGQFGGLIQAVGNKYNGWTYIDGITGYMLTCTANTSIVEPDADIFKDFTNKSLLNRINSFDEISTFSTSGSYTFPNGEAVTYGLTAKRRGNVVFYLVTTAVTARGTGDSGFYTIFSGIPSEFQPTNTTHILLAGNYNEGYLRKVVISGGNIQMMSSTYPTGSNIGGNATCAAAN